jgi:hypothetical protein
MACRTRKANLLGSTKPPSLYEITYGGISALASQLKGRWEAKGEGFASAALCQRTACDADVLGTQLKVAKSFFR